MPKESCAQKGICLSRVFTFLFKSLWDFLICNFLMVSSMWGPFHAAATFSLAWERLSLKFANTICLDWSSPKSCRCLSSILFTPDSARRISFQWLVGTIVVDKWIDDVMGIIWLSEFNMPQSKPWVSFRLPLFAHWLWNQSLSIHLEQLIGLSLVAWFRFQLIDHM